MTPIPALALVYPPLLAYIASTPNQTIFANDDGVAYIVDTSEPPLDAVEVAQLTTAAAKTSFFLYTRYNPTVGQELFIDDLDTLRNSYWDPKRPTRLVTHGWHGSIDTVACTLIRDAYLEAGDYNVILIDWREAASYLMYWKSANCVPAVAARVALMLDFLQKRGSMDPEMCKVIGHSLGAHVSGIGARLADGDINGVVALDPARPMFSGKEPGARVDKTDATLVHVIHTNAGQLGMLESVGIADFYPNGGTDQPGCSRLDLIGVCAHSRSYMYYGESILNPRGFRAESFGNPLNHVFMGGPILDPHAKGVYILETNSESPFALG